MRNQQPEAVVRENTKYAGWIAPAGRAISREGNRRIAGPGIPNVITGETSNRAHSDHISDTHGLEPLFQASLLDFTGPRVF